MKLNSTKSKNHSRWSRYTLHTSRFTFLARPKRTRKNPFMPNEPNFQKTRLTVTLYMIRTYNDNQPKKPQKKRTQNTPKMNKNRKKRTKTSKIPPQKHPHKSNFKTPISIPCSLFVTSFTSRLTCPAVAVNVYYCIEREIDGTVFSTGT